MSTNSRGEELLHPEDLQNLMREGTIIAGNNTGVYHIHKRRLNRYSDEEYKDLALPSPPENPLGRSDIASLDDFKTVPDHIISRETLDYLGFTNAAASEIWDRWNSFGDDDGREIDGGPVTFGSMFRAHIRYENDTDTCSDDDDAWRETMDGTGIAKSLQDAIMSPSCRDIRLTESCKYWLLDTICAKYASLKEMQAASKERAMAARRAASGPSASDSGSLLPGQITNSSGSRSTSHMFHGMPGMSLATATSPEACSNVPGHTILYRSSYSTATRIFDEQGNAEGNKMGRLLTRRPRNFNSTKNAVYMDADFDVAQKYAFWCKKRDPSLAVCLLRMEIPNAAIEALDDNEKLEVYWPSQEWKQIVWECRNREPLRKQLYKFARATLVIGTICSKPKDFIANLATPDNITQSMILPKRGGGGAVQYAFICDQGLDFLGGNGTDKCIAHPFTCENAQEFEEAIGNI